MMHRIETILEAAPIIVRSIAHRSSQGAVTFLYGEGSVYVERVTLPSGDPIDPEGADEALEALSDAFAAAGWTVDPVRDEKNGELISVIFGRMD